MSSLLFGFGMLAFAAGLLALRWRKASPRDGLSYFWRHEADLVTYALAFCYMPFLIGIWNLLQYFGLPMTGIKVAFVLATAVVIWQLHQKAESYKVGRPKEEALRLLGPLRLANLFMYVGVLWEIYGLLQLALSEPP